MKKILIFAAIGTLIACNAFRELPGARIDGDGVGDARHVEIVGRFEASLPMR